MTLNANLIGATGLVGEQLVNLLLDNKSFEKVRIFVRRDTGISHPKLEQHIIDFSKTKEWQKQTALKIMFLFHQLVQILIQNYSIQK